MTVSDFILDYLESLGINHVFLVTGGAIAFTIDAFAKRKGISYVCMQHEQAASMAADAYSRVGPGIGAAMSTSGPGATNLLTGICCSWFDSIPTIFITGQVNTYEQKGDLPVRQIGFQETDIVEMAKPVTKFAQQLDRPENIKYFLEKATYIATSGRPGPVLLDIPQNFQRAVIKKKDLKSFTPPTDKSQKKSHPALEKKIIRTIDYLNKSKKPVLLVGGGVRNARAENEIIELANILKIPVVTSWSGCDLVPYNYKYRIGNLGVCGDRHANFVIQSADLIISIGSRLDTRQTGGKPETFAPNAKKVVVDIDTWELKKKRGLKIDLPIQADAKVFIDELINLQNRIKVDNISSWLEKCNYLKNKYPSVKKEYYSEDAVNPYTFFKTLSQELESNAIIIADTGATIAWTMQGFEIKKGQRIFSAFGNSPMGYALPAAIGASTAVNKKEIVCINGDGGFQMNIQELQTAVYNKLPLKIFILNNHSYGIIKQFQSTWLDGRFEASEIGYSTPDFIKIAKAYGIKTINITKQKNMKEQVRSVLKEKTILVCNVEIDAEHKISPRIEYGKPIEDMYPFLPKNEIEENIGS